VIGAHQFHAQVDPGGQPGAGQHRSLIHPEHIRVDLHRRVPGGELVGVLPVRGGLAVIKESGRGQREGAGADGDHPGAARGGLAQRRAHPLTRILQRQRYPGTTTVSALASASRPCSACTQ
jgi:hypothetical protein